MINLNSASIDFTKDKFFEVEISDPREPKDFMGNSDETKKPERAIRLSETLVIYVDEKQFEEMINAMLLAKYGREKKEVA